MSFAKVILSVALVVILQALTIRARFFEDDVDEALYGGMLEQNDDSAEDDCKDTNPMCPEWNTYKYCTKPEFREKMKKECRKTCGLCATYCRDKEASQCSRWKGLGYCETNLVRPAELMKQFCAKTCGYCHKKAAISKCAKASGSSFGCCWDGKEKIDVAGSNCRPCKDVEQYALHVCRQFRSSCDNGGITESWMSRFCPSTCGLCGHKGECIDREKRMCAKWEKNGYCDHENVDIRNRMIKYCAKTCGICEEESIHTQRK